MASLHAKIKVEIMVNQMFLSVTGELKDTAL